MLRLAKISIHLIVIGLLTFSCKTKEDGNSRKHNSLPIELTFKNKFHDANSEKMIGHYDKSILLFKECLLIDPKSAACNFALSEIYLKLNESEKSLEFAQKSFDLSSKNKWYLIHLSDIYHSVGNYHQSANYYDILFSDFNEKNINYRYKLVEALIFSNQNKKAISQLNILELELGKTPEISLTKHDLYNTIGEKEKAKQEITTLLNEHPKNEEIRTQILDYYLQTNQLIKAKSIANDILDINENNGNAYLGLADLEIRSNNIEKSFDYLERGFADENIDSERKMLLLNGLTSYAFDNKDPNSIIINKRLERLYKTVEEDEINNATFLLLYGSYLNMNNHTKRARAKFLQSIKINPSDYRAWDALLNADYTVQLFDSLFIDGQMAIELFPTQPMVYLLTGIGAYESMHFEEAEEYLFLGKDIVINNPELSSEFDYHMGKSLWKSGRSAEGKIYFDKALITYPENAKVYNGYALLLKDDNKLIEAELQIKKALNIEPKNETYLDLYGQILFELNKYIEAEEVYKLAVVIDYTNPSILEHYGNALFLNGKIENVLEMWKEAQKQGNQSKLLDKKIRDKKYYEI